MKRLLPILFILAFAPALWGAIKVNPITSAEPTPMTNVVLGITAPAATNIAAYQAFLATNGWSGGSAGSGHTNLLDSGRVLIVTNLATAADLEVTGNQTNKADVQVDGTLTATTGIVGPGSGITGLTNGLATTAYVALATNSGNLAFLTANSNWWAYTMRFGSNVYFDVAPTFTNTTFEGDTIWNFTNTVLMADSDGIMSSWPTNLAWGTGLPMSGIASYDVIISNNHSVSVSLGDALTVDGVVTGSGGANIGLNDELQVDNAGNLTTTGNIDSVGNTNQETVVSGGITLGGVRRTTWPSTAGYDIDTVFEVTNVTAEVAIYTNTSRTLTSTNTLLLESTCTVDGPTNYIAHAWKTYFRNAAILEEPSVSYIAVSDADMVLRWGTNDYNQPVLYMTGGLTNERATVQLKVFEKAWTTNALALSLLTFTDAEIYLGSVPTNTPTYGNLYVTNAGDTLLSGITLTVASPFYVTNSGFALAVGAYTNAGIMFSTNVAGSYTNDVTVTGWGTVAVSATATNESGASWVPTDVAGLQLWFKADAGVTNTSDASPPSDGETVKGWADQSGNGNFILGAAAKPTYETAVQNGKPVIQFVAANLTYLSNSFSGLSGADQPFTLIAAMSVTSTNSIRHYVLSASSGSDADPHMRLFFAVDGTYAFIKSDNTATVDSVARGPSTTDFHILTLVCSGTTASVYLNNVQLGATDTVDVGDSTFDTFRIGRTAADGSYYLDGNLGEYILYDSAISDANRTNAFDYLEARWNAVP